MGQKYKIKDKQGKNDASVFLCCHLKFWAIGCCYWKNDYFCHKY